MVSYVIVSPVSNGWEVIEIVFAVVSTVVLDATNANWVEHQ